MTEQYGTVFRLFLDNGQVIPSDLSTYTSQNFKRLLATEFLNRHWSSSTYNSYRRYLRCYCEFLRLE